MYKLSINDNPLQIDICIHVVIVQNNVFLDVLGLSITTYDQQSLTFDWR